MRLRRAARGPGGPGRRFHRPQKIARARQIDETQIGQQRGETIARRSREAVGRMVGAETGLRETAPANLVRHRLVRSTSQFLCAETLPATRAQSDALQIRAGGVIAIHRIRHVDGRPVMHDRLVMAQDRLPDWPLDSSELPALLHLHLLEGYGIRISALREQTTADLASDEDMALHQRDGRQAVLTIDEVAYDQAGVPTILGWHRATTAAHAYVNEVR